VDGSIVGKITLGPSSCSGSSFSGGGGGGVDGFLTTGFPSLSSSTGGGGSGIISLALKSQNSSSYTRHNMNIIEIETVSSGSFKYSRIKKTPVLVLCKKFRIREHRVSVISKPFKD
jgi:hypothetical protein